MDGPAVRLSETNRAALERVLQLTTILLGQFLTASTFAWELTGFEASSFLDADTLAGLGFLPGSFTAGIFGFRSHEQIIGIGPKSLAVIADGYDETGGEEADSVSDYRTITEYELRIPGPDLPTNGSGGGGSGGPIPVDEPDVHLSPDIQSNRFDAVIGGSPRRWRTCQPTS